MINDRTIAREFFDKICKDVCHQLVPSGSPELDRETLYFAVYWKLCDVVDQQLIIDSQRDTKISMYRRQIQRIVQHRQPNGFDVLRVTDKTIEERIRMIYSMKATSACEN